MSVSFRRIFKPNRPTQEYYSDSWSYFTDFVSILKERGAVFITMSDAFRGDYDVEKINIILDHHIDFYPAETEVMCRWELENELVSSVYLFNFSPYADRGQPQPWRLSDLNLPFYKKLEQAGFEVGYHSNAVGQARMAQRADVPYYTTEIPVSVLSSASSIFEHDVQELREHFDIRTFIPHGGGEGNHQLLDLPESCRDVIWAYNGRPAHSRPAPKWKNFSDSNTFYPQRMSGAGATYIARIDNLHLFAHLAEPGLSHILLHCGRYARGMPYELYQGPTPLAEDLFEDRPYRLPKDIAAPVSGKQFVVARKRTRSDVPRPEFSGTRKYYLFTDSEEVLEAHLSISELVIPTLIIARKITSEEKDNFRVERGVEKADFPLPALEGEFVEEFRSFINLAFSPSPFRHLEASSIPLDVVHLKHVQSSRYSDTEAIRRILQRIPPDGQAHIVVTVEENILDRWKALLTQECKDFRSDDIKVCLDEEPDDSLARLTVCVLRSRPSLSAHGRI